MIDVLADERLPALVRGIVLELPKRFGEVVALDQVKEVAAAAPDRPIADPGAPVRCQKVVGDPLVRGVVELLPAGLEHGVKRDVSHQAGVGASSRSRRSALSSLQRSAAIGRRYSSALPSICAGERAPTQTLTTEGWASGKARAAAGNVVPCRSHTAAIARARSTSPRGASL